MKIGTLSLGCPKNQVDTEYMLGLLEGEGHEIVTIGEAEMVVVNTCAFLQAAVEESIESILDICRSAPDKSLIVTGCLPQRFGSALLEALPEVDYIVGVGNLHMIGQIVSKVAQGEKGESVCDPVSPFLSARRHLLSPPHYAYLKIADGCSNRCAYCLIPLVRGEFRSRPRESILEEASSLAEGGVKELILVAQDTSLWGVDLPGQPSLPGLVWSLSELAGIEWIRILYLHPAHLPHELGRALAECGKACDYLDLPIQHISDSVLGRMNRRVTGGEIRSLIEGLRNYIPGLALRTTVMVGFPGETDTDFGELVEFVEETRFDALGIFRYSREEETVAFSMEGLVDDEVAEERSSILQEIQREISLEKNLSLVGSTQKVLVDFRRDCGCVCRTERQAPEIDGIVRVESDSLTPGEFAHVTIVSANDYDLIGRALP